MSDMKFVARRNYGSKPLGATETDRNTAEKFEILRVGTVPNWIALRSCSSMRFLSVASNGVVSATAERVGRSETFEEIKLNDGSVALRCVANQRFLCADKHQDNSLVADRMKIDQWERFQFIALWDT